MELFDSIIESGYYAPFGRLTAAQAECKQFTVKHMDELLRTRQREKFLRDVTVCACGFGEADEEEPMDEANFSQHQFFLPFTYDLVFFVDKFDFVVKCVAHGVCKVADGFEDRYMRALLTAMTFRHLFIPAKPEQVLDLRQLTTPRTIGEADWPADRREASVQAYVARRHSFGDGLRAELAGLEEEQFSAERARGEHRSQMGWDEEAPPADDDAAPTPAAEEAEAAPAAAEEEPASRDEDAAVTEAAGTDETPAAVAAEVPAEDAASSDEVAAESHSEGTDAAVEEEKADETNGDEEDACSRVVLVCGGGEGEVAAAADGSLALQPADGTVFDVLAGDAAAIVLEVTGCALELGGDGCAVAMKPTLEEGAAGEAAQQWAVRYDGDWAVIASVARPDRVLDAAGGRLVAAAAVDGRQQQRFQLRVHVDADAAVAEDEAPVSEAVAEAPAREADGQPAVAATEEAPAAE
jgi:hypothetical protein